MIAVKFHGQDSRATPLEQEQTMRAYWPEPNMPFYSAKSDNWSGSYKVSAFERILHQELQRIKQREKNLKENLASLRSPNQEQKLAMKQQYLSIQNAKKILEMIVNQMEKSIQNILANFR